MLDTATGGFPWSVDDLEADELPVLLRCEVPAVQCVDGVTDEGCLEVGLPATYLLDVEGVPIPHAVCQQIGARAWESGETGVA